MWALISLTHTNRFGEHWIKICNLEIPVVIFYSKQICDIHYKKDTLFTLEILERVLKHPKKVDLADVFTQPINLSFLNRSDINALIDHDNPSAYLD